jgi:hypothetical protein
MTVEKAYMVLVFDESNRLIAKHLRVTAQKRDSLMRSAKRKGYKVSWGFSEDALKILKERGLTNQ